jgi:uncharacterized protein (DUF1499 family)
MNPLSTRKKIMITLPVLMLSVVLLLIVIFLMVKAANSHHGEAPGLNKERLLPCPAKPNCLCSEFQHRPQHHTAPLDYGKQEAQQAWLALKQAVVELGGKIITDEGGYLAAEFSTPLFGFVDDLEARLDSEQGVIHIRSASRQGHSDFGANRKRLAALRTRFQAYLN